MNINPVSAEINHSVGVITIDYPPVNALSQKVRVGLMQQIEQLENNDAVKIIIIRCEGRTFIAGADIKEFSSTPLEPHLPEVVNRIENSTKPIIASIFGTSLGGGFEVALACHYRVAVASAKVGLPEVNLGLIPGAGGTQRLPRIVATNKALEMITTGKHYSVSDFSEFGLFDAIFADDINLDLASLKFAQQLLTQQQLPTKPVGKRNIVDTVEDWSEQINTVTRKARGKLAPVVACELIKKSRSLTLTEGMKLEREAFMKLKNSDQSAALRYAFSAEKLVTKTGFKAEPYAVNKVGIIGGGTMGSGIATVFLISGFEVVLIEQNNEAVEQGVQKINNNFAANLKTNRMTNLQLKDCENRLTSSIDYTALKDCDLVIEAVFENMAVKHQIFKKLAEICKPDCVLATNTSYLDINQIAAVVTRPEQVIGMHFFSPANIMKLLEVVQAKQSSEKALVTAMAIAKKLGKIPVLVGVCFGFAGNRMYTRYGREIQQMLLEGARVSEIDRALTNWGMAMGPLAVADMSGLDIGYHARSSQPFPDYDPGYFKPAELMFQLDRYGRKTQAGYYQYDDNGRAIEDPEVDNLIAAKAAELNIPSQSFSEQDIVNRALYALISEGLQLLEDGIVKRASDLDVIWLHGYGFPRHKGGPMFQAQQYGKQKLDKAFAELTQKEGDKIWPKVNTGSLFLN
jgi:3-hydroxyacyl-CoA dehydrogenase